MIINDGKRALCYNTRITNIRPIEGADNIDLGYIGGWPVIIKKGEFQDNDIAIFFEIDSKIPQKEWSSFLEPKGYKVKTYKLGKFKVVSQGLALPLSVFSDEEQSKICAAVIDWDKPSDLTDILGVTYSVIEDNRRKSGEVDPETKYASMKARHKKIFSNKFVKKMMKYLWFRKTMFFFFGRKQDTPKGFPTHFPGVSKTDQERVENMTWVLKDKTPFIRTQKCDGSSGTYILERKPFNKFEFYVCSRNVRLLKPEQECFHDKNYYWEVAIKYGIEQKMKNILAKNRDMKWICWQGEVCAPSIQSNPHHLKDAHLFLFHWTDSLRGRRDIRDAAADWKELGMETVPIDEEPYILPDSIEEFKATADGKYDAVCCEGNSNCRREGFVYYKTTDPTFSFKNVSREYLLKRKD